MMPSALTFAARIPIALLFTAAMLAAQPAGWTAQSSPTAQNLRAVAFGDPAVWIAVGDAGTILRSSDGGIHWTSISSPVVDPLRGVSLRGSLGLAVGISGRVLRTTDGGLNWTQESRPTSKNLYAVSVGGRMTVATGEEGTILVSLDDGLTWTPHTAGTASILFGVSVQDSTAVGVGGQGAVVMSVDRGKGWGLTLFGQTLFFYAASFVSRATGWAAGVSAASGGLVMKSSDAGFVWSGESIPTTEQLFGISFATLDAGSAVGTGGTIIRTSDGGATWTGQSSGTTQTLNAVSFADPRFGVAVGDAGTILRTTTGGVTSLRGDATAPERFALAQNFPNPFSARTTIRYELPAAGRVTLTVCDALGRERALLVDEQQQPGSHFA